MAGADFLKFLPLNETALERQPHLKSMIRGWLSDDWKFATMQDWFHEVFKDPNGAFIWSPSPALACVAVDQLCEVKHIFSNSKHVLICPSLMTGYWQKQLGKLADTLFTIKENTRVWRKGMHEPLTIAFVCPLLSESPWKASRLDHLVDWEAKMSKVQWKHSRIIRHHMREFGCCFNDRKLCNGAWHGKCFVQDVNDNFPVLQVQDLDDSLVEPSRFGDEDPKRFKEARDGDHLMTPFQCPECHFTNITGRLPRLLSHKDALAMKCIKRATLDSLLAQERSTAQSNRLEGEHFLASQQLLGFETHCFSSRGSYPKHDVWECSWRVALSCDLWIQDEQLPPSSTKPFESNGHSIQTLFTHVIMEWGLSSSKMMEWGRLC
jgi:hypothetical protein